MGSQSCKLVFKCGINPQIYFLLLSRNLKDFLSFPFFIGEESEEDFVENESESEDSVEDEPLKDDIEDKKQDEDELDEEDKENDEDEQNGISFFSHLP